MSSYYLSTTVIQGYWEDLIALMILHRIDHISFGKYVIICTLFSYRIDRMK